MKRLACVVLILVCLTGCETIYESFGSLMRGSDPSEQEVDYYRRIGREP